MTGRVLPDKSLCLATKGEKNNTPKEKNTSDNKPDNQEVSQTNSTLAGNRTLI